MQVLTYVQPALYPELSLQPCCLVTSVVGSPTPRPTAQWLEQPLGVSSPVVKVALEGSSV